MASRSRGTPRIANRLFKRVRDFALVKGDGNIDKDIINISNKYDEHYISLSEAINLVPELQRKDGLFITFQDVNGNWQFYQFRGTLEEFSEEDKWFNLDFEKYLKETLIPITNIEIDNLSK